jgi:CheY-like chemotaxis protein
MAKIMLVEDDNNLREIYGARLTAEGFEIVSAADGEEALAMAVKEKPDLIITDVMMPKISGFDVLDILRSTPETKYTKVIMMTALSQDDDKKRGEALGADRYLVKSQVTLEDVVNTVHDVLDDDAATPAPVTTTVEPQAVAPAADPAQPTPAPATSDGNAPQVTQPAPEPPTQPQAVAAPAVDPGSQSQPAEDPVDEAPIPEATASVNPHDPVPG